jgi:hypothetical protein
MIPRLASTNVSFDQLKGSSDFLYLLLNNISSCVLLLNNKMELQAFNDVLKTVFSNKEDEDLLYQRCGEALGCAHHIEEHKECGSTSHCCDCELRVSALTSYIEDKVIFKEHFTRPFYNLDNHKIEKHLQFSTRLFHHKRDKYIVLIVEDITKFFANKAGIS